MGDALVLVVKRSGGPRLASIGFVKPEMPMSTRGPILT